MNKKMVKIISIIMLVLCLIMSATVCFAEDLTANGLQDKSENILSSEDTNSLSSVGATIMAIIRNVGIIVAVVMLMVLGIKYMMGSAEEKAEYKKTMMPYLIGAVLLFGAAAIAQAVISLTNSI